MGDAHRRACALVQSAKRLDEIPLEDLIVPMVVIDVQEQVHIMCVCVCVCEIDGGKE